MQPVQERGSITIDKPLTSDVGLIHNYFIVLVMRPRKTIKMGYDNTLSYIHGKRKSIKAMHESIKPLRCI